MPDSGTIYVINRTQKSVTMRAADGDEIAIPPGAVNKPVEAKFLWSYPRSKIEIVSQEE